MERIHSLSTNKPDASKLDKPEESGTAPSARLDEKLFGPCALIQRFNRSKSTFVRSIFHGHPKLFPMALRRSVENSHRLES